MIDQAKTPQKLPVHQFTDLKTVLAKYFYHWPLFLIGLVVTLFVAMVYLQLTKPVYEISATILVKDEKKSPQEKSNLEEIDLSNSPKNAETEVQVITSKKLIAQVVSNLNLHIGYATGDFNQQDLFQHTPIKLVGLSPNLVGKHNFSVLIEDENTLSVSGSDFETKKIRINEYITNNLGKWKIEPTATLKSYIGQRIRITVSDPEKVIKAYTKALDARLLDKSAPTIGLFLTDAVPYRGKQFLNALISAYNSAAATEERRITKSTIDFIDKRLSSLTIELGDAENKVEGYRSSQGITDLTAQSKVYLENVQTNDSKLNDVNVQLSNIDGIENYVNAAGNKNIAPPTLGIADEVLNSLVKNLTELQLKRVSLLATTPERNPLFEPINSQIKTTKAAIKENISGMKASLLSEKRELQSINQKVESSIKDIPGQERQFVGMKRQASIKENLYVYLLQKREELALSYASTQAEARIVDHANIGEVKWPRPPLVMVIALLLGLGIPFMIIYFRYVFSQKITNKQEIENELDVPIIGEISYEHLNAELIVMDKDHQIIGEQFRAIRTNIFHYHKERRDLEPVAEELGNVTLCTSSTANEGKSFIASNLATAMASSGRKTVLLEMDLRRPRIAKIFELSKSLLGISEFLSAKAPIEHVIHPSGIQENLSIVSSGQILNNPSELLEGQRIKELIERLKVQFDEIVIDSPPLHLVTDAMIIDRYADVCLYIIRQGHTSKQELAFIRELSSQISNMRIIFNGIMHGKYGYGYKYDRSYYRSSSKNRGFMGSWKMLLGRL